jgi:hypothetical protein
VELGGVLALELLIDIDLREVVAGAVIQPAAELIPIARLGDRLVVKIRRLRL